MRINLYKSYINRNDIDKIENKEEIYYSLEKSLLAINIKNFSSRDKLSHLKKVWKTRSIEVYQKNFMLLLLYSKELNITVRDITFEYEDDELGSEIKELIASSNTNKIIDIINEENLIIDKVTFILNDAIGNLKDIVLEISQKAEIDIECFNCTIKESEILEQNPVKLLLGIWYPQKRTSL